MTDTFLEKKREEKKDDWYIKCKKEPERKNIKQTAVINITRQRML